MESINVSVTLSGPNFQAIVNQAKLLIEGETNLETAPTKRGKRVAADKLADVAEESNPFAAQTEEVNESFDSEPAPTKSAKKTKLTEKEVNTAAMAHAKEHGRPATLAILAKKFKVKSILELKPEQYDAVLEALT